MLRQFRFRFVLACVVLGLPLVVFSQAEGTASPWPAAKREVPSTARRVLDELFPRTFERKFFVVLRFLPSDSPESQIVIWSDDEQSYDIVWARANKNVNGEVGRVVLATGQRDETSLAKLFSVKAQRVRVPREIINSWLSAFYGMTVAAKPHDRVGVDGMLHELWFKTSNGERVHFEYGEPSGLVESHPLIQWMNRVKADVERYAKQ